MSFRVQNTFSNQVEDQLKHQIAMSLIESEWMQEGSPEGELKVQELLVRVDSFRAIIQSLCDPQTGAAFSRDLETIQNRCTAYQNPSASADLEVRFTVPFGHTLFIRGSGSELNWNRGIPLREKAEGIFAYHSVQPLESGTEYKFLYNDDIWKRERTAGSQTDGSTPGPPNLYFPNKALTYVDYQECILHRRV